MKRYRLSSAAALAIFIVQAFLGRPVVSQQSSALPFTAEQKMLSDYLPSLKCGPGDSPLYVLDGMEPGGTVFICAGAHGNEIAGVVAAVILKENIKVVQGRIIVLPRANRSAAMYSDPGKHSPRVIRIPTAAGERLFAYGSRLTHPGDELLSDILVYPSGIESALDADDMESRNLNRAYPGNEHGRLTARIAFAISRLIETEDADLAIDLHESDPESKLSWMIISNPKNIDIAAAAVLSMEEKGLRMGIDSSDQVQRGLSHREWGDRTKAKAFLIETPNPAQISLTGSREESIDLALSLGNRVAVQLAAVTEIIAAYNVTAPSGRRVLIEGIPTSGHIEDNGLGALLGQQFGARPKEPIIE